MQREVRILKQFSTAVIKDRFFLGGPDEVAEQIIKYSHETGINHHVFSVQWPGMPQSLAMETIQLLAEEVFPKVREGMWSTLHKA